MLSRATSREAEMLDRTCSTVRYVIPLTLLVVEANDVVARTSIGSEFLSRSFFVRQDNVMVVFSGTA